MFLETFLARLAEIRPMFCIRKTYDDLVDLVQDGSEPQNLIVRMCNDQNRFSKCLLR